MATPEALEYVKDLGSFVAASPSSFHAAAEVARRLDAAGFTAQAEADAWDAAPGGHYTVRDGAVIAWHVPETATATTGFHILGSHTDSPGFKLKPKPTTGREGWLQAGVEVYGGPLLNSWLDRELILAGRLVTADGAEHLVRTGPLLRIPQLAIHLDRAVNDGFTLDKQAHANPVWGLGNPSEADLLAVLAADAGVDPETISGYDITTTIAQAPEVFGADDVFLASARLDNLSSVHASLRALLDHAGSTGAATAGHIAVLAAFDHEEVGSASRSGASGPFLQDVLERIVDAAGGGVQERARAFAGSVCVSADAGHAVHPNYAERHDPANRPVLGGGPLLKINANQRYTTDAVGAGLWARLCADADVPYQEFVSSNVMPCGSTIGPLTATRLGIRTVDVGIALLSMHSAREMCAVEDPLRLARVAEGFFTA
ncbi:M18 family aminopeptidase [Arthrobacter sp. JSM 101049]|uniref:M18 family aminopeptidase n=1 Tax=Arthrobacter sp. JSM 101049 TaxID=929097 RepID=UPI0035631243